MFLTALLFLGHENFIKVFRYYVAVAQRPKFKQNYIKMPLFR